MNGNQRDLFGDEVSSAVNPRGEFAEFRVGKKIIQIPCSVWRDGRIRADLSKYGAGEVVSRRRTNLNHRIADVLRPFFEQAVEAICGEFERPPTPTPRLSNKRPLATRICTEVRYINPFSQNWTFGKCPDWLLTRREPTAVEKHVYGKLLYPAPPICRRWDVRIGIIFELNQGQLAKAIGISRPAANRALMSLRRRGLLELTGQPGARQVVRFLQHEWITCNLKAQVGYLPPVNESDKPCSDSAQGPATSEHKSCPVSGRVSRGIEKRESLREEKRRPSSSWCPWAEGTEAERDEELR
jgi:hypothetical protein